ncbi:MAG TPA: hypothetical protein EYP78_03785 [Candidatus Omnitrophica bacterium]|nr:hypothetical protein [Candidatus Omnitrophota bacterium]
MSHKLLNIICALTLVLGSSLIAKAEVQNVRVGGDIEVRGIWQQDMDLIAGDDRGGDNTAAATDLYYAVTRAYISAELTDNVSTNIRFLNDRVWGEAANWMGPLGPVIFGGLSGPTGDEVAIDLAYLTLSEIYDYPMSIYIGRQEIKVGEGFLIGDAVNDVYASDTKGDGNADTYVYGPRKAFDAIRTQWSYEPHTIDLIIAKVNEVIQELS